MARSGRVNVDIAVNSAGADRDLRRAEGSLNRLKGAAKGVALAGGAAAFTGLALAIHTGTQEMLEQEKASAQTAAAIKSTGGAANVTQKQIEGMASALQTSTSLQDDAIQSAQNMLLTFTNVRNEAGKGNAVFNQATRAALDLSVAFNKDLAGSAVLVGKALNDPIKGISALSRVGVTFTAQQKEQIKTLTESGRTLDAQKIILRELNKETGGSAKALGDSVPGQLAKIQRAWEDVSESLVRQFLPIVTDLAKSVLKHMDVVKAAFDGIGVAVKGMIRFVGALIRGDWQKAWDIAAQGAGRALRAIGIIVQKVVVPIAQKAGEAIVRGLQTGFERGINSLPAGSLLYKVLRGDSVVDIVSSSLPSSTGTIDDYLAGRRSQGREARRGASNAAGGRAMGGFLPGTYQGRDTMTIRAAPGEVILNPSQQRMVGIDRIMSTLRRTGGVIGGDGFAGGGVVGGAAIDFLKAQVGKGYTPGGTGAGQRMGPSYWDCSGLATTAASMFPGFKGTKGGTTFTEYGSSSPAKGDEPVVYGFRSYGSSQWGNGYQHMGIRVGGTWYDAGSGGVQVGDSRWDVLRVPAGLSGLSASAISTSGADPQRDGKGGTTKELTPRQKLGRLLSAVLGGPGAGGAGDRKSAITRLGGGVTDFSGSAAGASLSDGQTAAQTGAGRAARTAARKAGLSPDQVTKAGDDAERNAEVKFLTKNLALAKEDLSKLRFQKQRLLNDLLRVQKAKAGKPGAKKALAAKYRIKIRAITLEMSEMRGVIAEVNARLAEIGEAVAEERYDAAYDAAHEGDDSSSATDSAAGADLSADQQAQIDQANQRATTAERGSAISASFVRTLFQSGSIDPQSGGINVTINTLHPGDPAIQGEVARWVVGALGGQGSVPATSIVSPA